MYDFEKKSAQQGGQQNSTPVQAKETNGIPNSALQDVFAGKKHATSEMMGHSQNLAPSIAAKMSRAFGMDLTGMQVYRSDAMVGSGMQGMAQGNKVVLSSDVNLNTTAGQAVLGHEISHIHAQSQGVGMGHSGLYENAALEHQADTEGLLAAQGRSIYSDGAMDMGVGMSYGLGMQGVEGMTTLGGGMSANAGAPMQAKKGGDEDESKRQAEFRNGDLYKKFFIGDTSIIDNQNRLLEEKNTDNEADKTDYKAIQKRIKAAKYVELPEIELGTQKYTSLMAKNNAFDKEKTIIRNWIKDNYWYCFKHNAMDTIKKKLSKRRDTIASYFEEAEKKGEPLCTYDVHGFENSKSVWDDIDEMYFKVVKSEIPAAGPNIGGHRMARGKKGIEDEY